MGNNCRPCQVFEVDPQDVCVSESLRSAHPPPIVCSTLRIKYIDVSMNGDREHPPAQQPAYEFNTNIQNHLMVRQQQESQDQWSESKSLAGNGSKTNNNNQVGYQQNSSHVNRLPQNQNIEDSQEAYRQRSHNRYLSRGQRIPNENIGSPQEHLIQSSINPDQNSRVVDAYATKSLFGKKQPSTFEGADSHLSSNMQQLDHKKAKKKPILSQEVEHYPSYQPSNQRRFVSGPPLRNKHDLDGLPDTQNNQRDEFGPAKHSQGAPIPKLDMARQPEFISNGMSDSDECRQRRDCDSGVQNHHQIRYNFEQSVRVESMQQQMCRYEHQRTQKRAEQIPSSE